MKGSDLGNSPSPREIGVLNVTEEETLQFVRFFDRFPTVSTLATLSADLYVCMLAELQITNKSFELGNQLYHILIG